LNHHALVIETWLNVGADLAASDTIVHIFNFKQLVHLKDISDDVDILASITDLENELAVMNIG